MKNVNLSIKILLPLTIIAFILGFRVIFYQQNSPQDLLGEYTSTDDVNWVWEFRSDGKLYDYYEGNLTDVYFFSIEKTSPQCGFEVDEGPLFEYFTRTNINKPSEKFCYEIYGLENGNLQLRYLGTNSFLDFKKTN
jgi:hypothetical protein